MAVLVSSFSPVTNPSQEKDKVCGFFASVPKIHGFACRRRFERVLASTHNAISRKDSSYSLPPLRNRNWFDDMDAELKNAFLEFDHGVRVMGRRPDPLVAQQLIARFCRINKTKKAIEVVEIMLGAGVLLNKKSYGQLVDHLCQRFMLGFAVQLIERMEKNGHKPEIFVYNKVLKVHCMKSQLDTILGWLNRFMEKGLALDNYSRSSLLKLVSSKRGVDEAMKLMDEMIAEGWKPHMMCYDIILNDLCRAGRRDEAVRLLDDLTSKGLNPNTATYNNLLSNLAYEGEWLKVKKLLAKMDAMEILHSASTYNILIAKLAEHGKIEEALQYMDEMLSEPFEPTTATYNPVIRQLCNEGKTERAFSCIKHMIHHGCYPNDTTYVGIAKLCEQGKVKDAFSIIQFLAQKQNSSLHYFYKGIIAALCRKRQTYSALQLLYEMVCDGFIPDSYNYASLIRGLCLEEMLGAVSQILGLLEENNRRLNIEIFNAMLEVFSRAGKLLLSIGVFKMMIEKGCKPNEMTYIYILEGIFDAGDCELASELMQELRHRDVINDRTVERLSLKYHLARVTARKREDVISSVQK